MDADDSYKDLADVPRPRCGATGRVSSKAIIADTVQGTALSSAPIGVPSCMDVNAYREEEPTMSLTSALVFS